MKKSPAIETPDREEKSAILIRGPSSLKKQLEDLAKEKIGGGVSLSAYCVDVLMRHVRKVSK